MQADDKGFVEGLKYVKDQKLKDKILKQKKEIEKQNLVRQLPLWPEPKRSAPNEIVRSALFNIRNHRVKREFYENIPVVVVGDGSITYNGAELRQDDLDVWLQVIHLAVTARKQDRPDPQQPLIWAHII